MTINTKDQKTRKISWKKSNKATKYKQITGKSNS